MMKVVLVAAAFLVAIEAKVIFIKNAGNHQLWVHWTGSEGELFDPNQKVNITVPEEWKGDIWAETRNCKDNPCKAPTTKARFDFNSARDDQYSVSINEGFNRRIKVTAVGDNEQWCRAAVCERDINKVCPKENQTVNDEGAVVGCKTVVELFRKLCPLAVVEEKDQPFTCRSSAYLVLLG